MNVRTKVYIKKKGRKRAEGRLVGTKLGETPGNRIGETDVRQQMRQQAVKQRAEAHMPKDDTAQVQQNQGTTRIYKVDELASWDWCNREEQEKRDIGREEERGKARSDLKGKGKLGDIPASQMQEKFSLVVELVSSSCSYFQFIASYVKRVKE